MIRRRRHGAAADPFMARRRGLWHHPLRTLCTKFNRRKAARSSAQLNRAEGKHPVQPVSATEIRLPPCLEGGLRNPPLSLATDHDERDGLDFHDRTQSP